MFVKIQNKAILLPPEPPGGVVPRAYTESPEVGDRVPEEHQPKIATSVPQA